MAPELVKAFVDEYCKEVSERKADAETTRHDLTDTVRRVEGVLKEIEDGNYQPSLTEHLTQLEARKTEHELELEAAPETPDLQLHPRLADIYRDKVKKLEEALNDPWRRAEALEIPRNLIARIVLFPTDDGLKGELTGDFASIFVARQEGGKSPDPEKSGSQLLVVARAGLELATHGL